MITGVIDDRGRLLGATEFATAKPSFFGENEKSVNWLLRNIPPDIMREPKASTDEVMETTLPSASRTTKCDVDCCSGLKVSVKKENFSSLQE